MTAFPERRAGGAERPGDDQQVARLGAVASRDTLGAADRRDRQIDRRGLRCVAAHDRDTRLVQALVELEDVLELDVAGDSERDEQAPGARPRRGECRRVQDSSLEAELAPARPVEPEVPSLDERVLRDDEVLAETR